MWIINIITRHIPSMKEVNERITYLFTWVLFLDIVGYYSLIQCSRARGAARRRAGCIVGVVRLIVRGMRGCRTRRTPGRYALLAEGWTGSAASPRSPAAATAIWHTADSRWAGDHAAASASTTPPGTYRQIEFLPHSVWFGRLLQKLGLNSMPRVIYTSYYKQLLITMNK